MKPFRLFRPVAICLSLFLSACLPEASPVQELRAIGLLDGKSGSALEGSAVFTQIEKQVTVSVDVLGAPPGTHAVAYLHETGDCSDSYAQRAGGAWNPSTSDLGHFVVGPDGTGSVHISSSDWALVPGALNNPVGHAVVIHAASADFQIAANNPGERIGCGVVVSLGAGTPRSITSSPDAGSHVVEIPDAGAQSVPDAGIVETHPDAGTIDDEPSGLDARPMNSSCQAVPAGQAPADTLSQTGCVDSADPRKPSAAMVPYNVNSPLWSDGAQKERYFAIPDGTTLTVMADGDIDFPIGTVLMKHFSLDGKRVETRLFMKQAATAWAGFSYEWNDDQSEATLLPSGQTKMVGTQLWTFPSRQDCMRCHTAAAGYSLGPELGQLNGDLTYPTGRTANQLKTLSGLGFFGAPLPSDVSAWPRIPSPTGNDPVNQRARAYLHANCSGCHRPGGVSVGMDFRFSSAFKDTDTCNVDPEVSSLNVEGAKRIYPGDPARSIVSLRLHATNSDRMPPVGRSLVDEPAVAVIDQWISSLTACP